MTNLDPQTANTILCVLIMGIFGAIGMLIGRTIKKKLERRR